MRTNGSLAPWVWCRLRRLKTSGEICGCWAAGVEVFALVLTVLIEGVEVPALMLTRLVERSVNFGARTTKLSKLLGMCDAKLSSQSSLLSSQLCVLLSMTIT